MYQEEESKKHERFPSPLSWKKEFPFNSGGFKREDNPLVSSRIARDETQSKPAASHKYPGPNYLKVCFKAGSP